jgi:hypothetical protein
VTLGSGSDSANLDFQVAAPPNNFSGTATHLDVTVKGGAGGDDIHASVAAQTAQRINLTGHVWLLGGQGNDDLALLVADNVFGLNQLIDGGLGVNTCAATAKVRVLRCKPSSVAAVGKW